MAKKPPKYKSPILCIVCGKKVKDFPTCPTDEPNYEMIDDGIVQRMYAPYGSKHDTDVFQIGICDECVDKAVADGRMKRIGNYMTGEGYYD